MQQSFIDEFINRGYFYQATDIDKLRQITEQESITAYIGFDCTARSLHVGNMMQLMILRLLQKHGHKILILMGGATTRIGDPTGKDEARKILDDEQIALNIAGIKRNIAQYITFGPNAQLVNNADWLSNIGYIDFLQSYGRLFSVNRLLSMDSIKSRLEREQNLSFLEFNYMLLQSYDFAYLNKHNNCRLQIGGSDQWGNIVSGIELIRKLGQGESFGITTPLITTASGTKMGKSESGAVWLGSEMLSVYNYWQFWRNSDDRDVFRFMRLFTDLTLTQISDYENSAMNINEAKKILATETTSICHGRSAAEEAAQSAHEIFALGGISVDLPSIELQSIELSSGVMLFDMYRKLGLCASGAEAKRIIKSNGAKVNDVTVNDEFYQLTLADVADDKIKLALGKKQLGIINIIN